MKRMKLSEAESYKHYLDSIDSLVKKNEMSSMPNKVITPLTQRQYKLAYTAQVNAAKMKGQHHPGSARIAEKIARETTYEASDKETKLWEKAIKEMGESDVPSRKQMKYYGMPSVLVDAINYVKETNSNLSSTALAQLIASQIFGSL